PEPAVGPRGLLRHQSVPSKPTRWPGPGVPALGRPLLGGHRPGHRSGRDGGHRQDGPARVGRPAVVLAAQRRLRRVPGRHVLRGARRVAAAGGLRRRRGMTDVASPSTSDTESDAAPRTPKAGKRDVWIVFFIVPAFYTAFGIIFFALTRTMPPPRPDITTAQMVDFFENHSTTIR